MKLRKVNFVGNREFSDRRLRRVLSSKQAGLLRKIIMSDILIDEKISLDKRLLTDFYRSRGFADFKINDVNTELSEEKDGFFITYNISEGPKFAVGQVNLRSKVNEILISDFKNFVTLTPGETYSPALVQSGITKLEDKLKARGFDLFV